MAGDPMSKRAAVDAALERIASPAGQGRQVFTRVYPDAARLAAETADAMSRAGVELPALAGVPVSVKDLFDVLGESTTAGSVVLKQAPVAKADAEVVRRLREAGAAIVGKTNMTEFAFSGLGLNPHYGTPLNTWDRSARRIPGGSSSGAAISITDGMADAAVGTDTGGSCRIPAALNGIVGFKPSAQTVPTAGALPLSSSYDSIGPLAKSVAMCARVFGVLSNTPVAVRPTQPEQLKLGVVRNYVLEQMDSAVGKAFEAALTRLSKAGATLVDVSLAALDELPALFVNGGLVAAEAYEWHQQLLESRASEYDPRVAVRIRRGATLTAADYIRTQKLRRTLISQWSSEISRFDAILMPTVPVIAPRLQDLEDDAVYGQINLLMLRNPTIVNALDGCAISIPCHEVGDAPVGLMIACRNGEDSKLLDVAAALEHVLQPRVTHLTARRSA